MQQFLFDQGYAFAKDGKMVVCNSSSSRRRRRRRSSSSTCCGTCHVVIVIIITDHDSLQSHTRHIDLHRLGHTLGIERILFDKVVIVALELAVVVLHPS